MSMIIILNEITTKFNSIQYYINDIWNNNYSTGRLVVFHQNLI